MHPRALLGLGPDDPADLVLAVDLVSGPIGGGAVHRISRSLSGLLSRSIVLPTRFWYSAYHSGREALEHRAVVELDVLAVVGPELEHHDVVGVRLPDRHDVLGEVLGPVEEAGHGQTGGDPAVEGGLEQPGRLGGLGGLLAEDLRDRVAADPDAQRVADGGRADDRRDRGPGRGVVRRSCRPSRRWRPPAGRAARRGCRRFSRWSGGPWLRRSSCGASSGAGSRPRRRCRRRSSCATRRCSACRRSCAAWRRRCRAWRRTARRPR